MAISACISGHKPISLYHSRIYPHVLAPCRPSAGRQLLDEPLLRIKYTLQGTKQLQLHFRRRHCSIAVRGKFRTHQHAHILSYMWCKDVVFRPQHFKALCCIQSAGLKQESLPFQSIKKDASRAGTGVFLLLVVNLALFAADKYLRYAVVLQVIPVSF